MNIAVIAAHPDDEILGCGGTIARHSLENDVVNVLILAEGITSRTRGEEATDSSGELRALANAARTASEIVGASSLRLYQFPDNRMDSVALLDVVKVVEEFINEYRPSLVYTHAASDLNIDHRITHEAVVTACRPLPGSTVETLLYFEVVSSTDWRSSATGNGFSTNWYVDISCTLQKKLEALRAYSSEMRPFPHARSLESVEALARSRGASVGMDAAEAFAVGRHVRRYCGLAESE